MYIINIFNPHRYGDATNRGSGADRGASAETAGRLPGTYEGGGSYGPNDRVLHPQPQVTFIYLIRPNSLHRQYLWINIRPKYFTPAISFDKHKGEMYHSIRCHNEHAGGRSCIYFLKVSQTCSLFPRSNKWWRRLFFYLMMVSVHNAYIVARSVTGHRWPGMLQGFVESLSMELVSTAKKIRAQPYGQSIIATLSASSAETSPCSSPRPATPSTPGSPGPGPGSPQPGPSGLGRPGSPQLDPSGLGRPGSPQLGPSGLGRQSPLVRPDSPLVAVAADLRPQPGPMLTRRLHMRDASKHEAQLTYEKKKVCRTCRLENPGVRQAAATRHACVICKIPVHAKCIGKHINHVLAAMP